MHGVRYSLDVKVRFANENDLSVLEEIYLSNPYSNKRKVSEDDVKLWCKLTIDKIKENARHVAIVTDNSGSLLGFASANPVHTIGGWMQGLTVMKNLGWVDDTPIIIAAGFDLLIEHYESLGYYKFWDIATERMLRARSIIMPYSKMLHRYRHFDEEIIPAGQPGKIKLWDMHRRINNTHKVISRMFVLDQQYRLELLNKK